MSFSSGQTKLSVISGCPYYAGVHRAEFHCTFHRKTFHLPPVATLLLLSVGLFDMFLKGPFKYFNGSLPTLFYTLARDTPTILYPDKGSPFAASLPAWSIKGSTPTPFALPLWRSLQCSYEETTVQLRDVIRGKVIKTFL